VSEGLATFLKGAVLGFSIAMNANSLWSEFESGHANSPRGEFVEGWELMKRTSRDTR